MNIASIILCAGKSSRLNSSKSKILHEICGRPIGYWPVKTALEVTNSKPVVVVNHQKQDVCNMFTGYFGDKLSFAHQKTANGTGGAVKAALANLESHCQSVLVLCGDTPLLTKESLEKLISIQKNSHVPVALLTARVENPFGYGRIIRSNSQHILGIVEEQDATPIQREIKEVNSGVYIFDVEFLKKNIKKLTTDNQKHELYLTDIVKLYIKSSAQYGPVGSFEINYEEMHGVNDRRQLANAQKILNKRMLGQWMDKGVTFIDPDNTYIEEGVDIAKDVTIHPGVHLRGSTSIDEGCCIENGSIISNSTLEKRVHILPYTCCDGANIEKNAQIGPFARLRPQTSLGKGVKIGNFVEIKNSQLKENSKASHLAYIGDSEVGSNCNIGAGSITCNYDGNKKHQTKIGDNAFIGSNSTLIAPLTIGNDAYIAAGSTINKEVGQKELAIARTRQSNKRKILLN